MISKDDLAKISDAMKSFTKNVALSGLILVGGALFSSCGSGKQVVAQDPTQPVMANGEQVSVMPTVPLSATLLLATWV